MTIVILPLVLYLGACLLSWVGGHYLAKWSVLLLRNKVGIHRDQSPIVLWLGGTERIVTTTLVIFAPSYVPAFIGGWIALKFALGWKRYAGPDAKPSGIIAMIGNVISFAVAIAAGLLVQQALHIWAR